MNVLKNGRSGAATLRLLSLTAIPAALVLALVLLLRQSSPVLAQEGEVDGGRQLTAWEHLFGMNLDLADEADEDSDKDGLTNKAESDLGTDPLASDTDRDGFLDSQDKAPLSRVYIEWGEPLFTRGDDYSYPAPGWFVGAFQKGGKWKIPENDDDPAAWLGGHDGEKAMVGRLVLVINPVMLDTDPVVEVDIEDGPGELFAGLMNGGGTLVQDDLEGNLMGGGNGAKKVKFTAPFKENPEAVALVLYRKSGQITVYRTMAYIDEDGDGLDREQEEQLGTSDRKIDTDGDGLSDYEEVFRRGTHPLNADSDGDGIPDGWEVAHRINPLVDDRNLDPDGDGRENWKEFLLGTDPNAKPAPSESEGSLVVGTPLEPEPDASKNQAE